MLFFIPVSVTCSISFCLHFGSKNEPKSNLKSIKTEIAGSCCSQGVPRPPQGCPRDPQGLHFGPFGLPKGAQGTPKGSILVRFEGTLPPLGATWDHYWTIFATFWNHFGSCWSQSAHRSKKNKKILKSKQRAPKKTTNSAESNNKNIKIVSQ